MTDAACPECGFVPAGEAHDCDMIALEAAMWDEAAQGRHHIEENEEDPMAEAVARAWMFGE